MTPAEVVTEDGAQERYGVGVSMLAPSIMATIPLAAATSRVLAKALLRAPGVPVDEEADQYLNLPRSAHAGCDVAATGWDIVWKRIRGADTASRLSRHVLVFWVTSRITLASIGRAGRADDRELPDRADLKHHAGCVTPELQRILPRECKK